MRAQFRFLGLSVALVALIAGLIPAFAAKPGGGGSTLPKVRYQIQLWSTPGGGTGFINDMNTQGQVIGWYKTSSGEKRAYLYDPSVNLTQAIDLNTIATPPTGWVIASAVGINDFGMIVGYLEPVGTDGTIRAGYILDISAASPVLQPIPDSEWSNTLPRAINEDGDILGLYVNANGFYGAYIYNPAEDPLPVDLGIELQHAEYCAINNSTATRGPQIALQIRDGSNAGIATRWTRAGGFETPLPGTNTSVRDINDSGMICGGTTAKLGKGPLQTYPFRYTNSLEILASPGLLAASRINSAGDLLVGNLMYREGTGFLKLDDLIDRTDPDAALWFSASSGSTWPSEMNDRIAGPEFGQLAGAHTLSTGVQFNYLLTPVSIP